MALLLRRNPINHHLPNSSAAKGEKEFWGSYFNDVYILVQDVIL